MILEKLNNTTINATDSISADFTVDFENDLKGVVDHAVELSKHVEAIASVVDEGTYNDSKNALLLNFVKELLSLLLSHNVTIDNIELRPYSMLRDKLTGERINWTKLEFSLGNTTHNIQFWKDKDEDIQDSRD